MRFFRSFHRLRISRIGRNTSTDLSVSSQRSFFSKRLRVHTAYQAGLFMEGSRRSAEEVSESTIILAFGQNYLNCDHSGTAFRRLISAAAMVFLTHFMPHHKVTTNS